MRLTKRQLKRIIREEYSRLKRSGLIKEGNWSQDPIEDAYMCALETCEMEPGSTQLVQDMYYIAEQHDLEDLLKHYVSINDTCSEETAFNFKDFLEDANEMENGEGTHCAQTFSSFWEKHYLS